MTEIEKLEEENGLLASAISEAEYEAIQLIKTAERRSDRWLQSKAQKILDALRGVPPEVEYPR